jgi:hypothetical protein
MLPKMSGDRMRTFYQSNPFTQTGVGMDRLIGEPDEIASAVANSATSQKRIEKKRCRTPSASPPAGRRPPDSGGGRNERQQERDRDRQQDRYQDRQDRDRQDRQDGGRNRDPRRGDSRDRDGGRSFCFKDFRDAYGLSYREPCPKNLRCHRIHLTLVPRGFSASDLQRQAAPHMTTPQLEELMKKVRYDQPRFKDDLGLQKK